MEVQIVTWKSVCNMVLARDLCEFRKLEGVCFVGGFGKVLLVGKKSPQFWPRGRRRTLIVRICPPDINLPVIWYSARDDDSLQVGFHPLSTSGLKVETPIFCARSRATYPSMSCSLLPFHHSNAISVHSFLYIYLNSAPHMGARTPSLAPRL